MPDRITSLVAPVRICTLAGTAYAVHEARLCDFADLQRWVDSYWVDPIDGLAGLLTEAGDDPVARDKVLFSLWAEVAEGPPVFDSDDGQVLLFGTLAGMAEFLRVAISRGNPGVDFDALAGTISEGSPEALGWFAAVCGAFYGNDSMGLLKRLMGVPAERPRGESLSWSESVVLLAKEFGWTLDYVLSLSVSQFYACYSGGKPSEHTLRLPHDQLKAFNDRRCMALYGEVPDEQVVTPYQGQP